MNEGNPGLNLGDDAADSIEGAFRRLRSMLLAGRKYLAVIRFELIRLYEIQQNLRQLSYFDVFGRLRLTLQLARVTLSIPMAIDTAMKEPENEGEGEEGLGRGEEPAAKAADADVEAEASASSDEDDEERGSDWGEEEEEEGGEFGMRSEDEEEDEDERGIVFDDDDDDDARDAATRTHPNGHGAPPPQGRSEEGRKQRKRRRRREARREARRAARAARNKPRRSGIEYADDEETGPEAGASKEMQKKGLLGPTAAGLLKGVVKVLETSEGWVPGGGSGSSSS